MRTYYHWTTPKGFLEISQVGVRPYKLMEHHKDVYSYCRFLGVPPYGIYVWPEITRRLARDFAVWKFLNYGIERGYDSTNRRARSRDRMGQRAR